METLRTLLWLAAAGAAGTLARFGLSAAVRRAGGGAWPWSTLTVNLLGAFLAGLVWGVLETRGTWKATVGIPVLIGFFGAFTTFSTVMLESGRMLRDGAAGALLANLALHNLGGLAAALLGIAAGLRLFRPGGVL